MKKITLYIATIFVIHLVSASQLNLNLSQYGTYHIVLNGVSYTIQDNFINFSKLASGNHHLKIVKHINTGYGVSLQKVICNSTINVPFRSSVYASLYSPYQLSVTDIVYHQQVTTSQHYCVNSCRHHHRHNYRYNSCNKNNGHYKNHYKGNGHYNKNNGNYKNHYKGNGHYKNNNGHKKNHHNGNNGHYKNNNGHKNNKNNGNGNNGNHHNGNYKNNKNNGNGNNGNHHKNNNGQKKTNRNTTRRS